MFVIVGKIMLTDIPRSCQDEYAATRGTTRKEMKRGVFAVIFRKGRALTVHVNLNTGGAATAVGSVKRKKATPV
jgi:hypothetical protein